MNALLEQQEERRLEVERQNAELQGRNFVGVRQAGSKWQVHLPIAIAGINRSNCYVGTYDLKRDAVIARDKAILEHLPAQEAMQHIQMPEESLTTPELRVLYDAYLVQQQ